MWNESIQKSKLGLHRHLELTPVDFRPNLVPSDKDPGGGAGVLILWPITAINGSIKFQVDEKAAAHPPSKWALCLREEKWRNVLPANKHARSRRFKGHGVVKWGVSKPSCPTFHMDSATQTSRRSPLWMTGFIPGHRVDLHILTFAQHQHALLTNLLELNASVHESALHRERETLVFFKEQPSLN